MRKREGKNRRKSVLHTIYKRRGERSDPRKRGCVQKSPNKDITGTEKNQIQIQKNTATAGLGRGPNRRENLYSACFDAVAKQDLCCQTVTPGGQSRPTSGEMAKRLLGTNELLLFTLFIKSPVSGDTEGL